MIQTKELQIKIKFQVKIFKPRLILNCFNLLALITHELGLRNKENRKSAYSRLKNSNLNIIWSVTYTPWKHVNLTTETVKKNLQQIKAHQTHHLLKSSKLGGIWIQLLGLLIENLKKVIADTLVN